MHQLHGITVFHATQGGKVAPKLQPKLVLDLAKSEGMKG